jgi:hypothetical protein
MHNINVGIDADNERRYNLSHVRIEIYKDFPRPKKQAVKSEADLAHFCPRQEIQVTILLYLSLTALKKAFEFWRLENLRPFSY